LQAPRRQSLLRSCLAAHSFPRRPPAWGRASRDGHGLAHDPTLCATGPSAFHISPRDDHAFQVSADRGFPHLERLRTPHPAGATTCHLITCGPRGRAALPL